MELIIKNERLKNSNFYKRAEFGSEKGLRVGQ